MERTLVYRREISFVDTSLTDAHTYVTLPNLLLNKQRQQRDISKCAVIHKIIAVGLHCSLYRETNCTIALAL